MQFRDLKQQYQALKPDIDAAMQSVAASSAFIMGAPVRELEAELAEYVGVKRCVSCANGTDALTLALKVWGIGAGDAVFVPDFTFFSSAEVVSLEGATPVFVDVLSDTYNIDVDDLERKVERTLKEGKLTPRVVIAVDLFGLPADYPRIREVTSKYHLLLLEDGAQGFGGRIGEQRACSFGDISTTSFFPAKPLGCYGDGGALFTDNEEWAALAESYRVHGKGTFKYDNVRIGMNSRLDTLQAAILQVKLRAFRDYELDAVNRVARRYTELLSERYPEIGLPLIPDGYYSSWAQYTIRLRDREERDALAAHLKACGIPTAIYYPTPMHSQTAYHDIPTPEGSCPVTDQLCACVLSLPMHPYLTDDEIETICGKECLAAQSHSSLG
jgi:dTDP-4-amino-4,6-dideoxygalactose transaminase